MAENQGHTHPSTNPFNLYIFAIARPSGLDNKLYKRRRSGMVPCYILKLQGIYRFMMKHGGIVCVRAMYCVGSDTSRGRQPVWEL